MLIDTGTADDAARGRAPGASPPRPRRRRTCGWSSSPIPTSTTRAGWPACARHARTPLAACGFADRAMVGDPEKLLADRYGCYEPSTALGMTADEIRWVRANYGARSRSSRRSRAARPPRSGSGGSRSARARSLRRPPGAVRARRPGCCSAPTRSTGAPAPRPTVRRRSARPTRRSTTTWRRSTWSSRWRRRRCTPATGRCAAAREVLAFLDESRAVRRGGGRAFCEARRPSRRRCASSASGSAEAGPWDSEPAMLSSRSGPCAPAAAREGAWSDRAGARSRRATGCRRTLGDPTARRASGRKPDE